MNKHTTFEIVAFVSAIMSALISAILLGVMCSFMIVTRDRNRKCEQLKPVTFPGSVSTQKMAIASLPKVAKYYHTHRMGAHRERIAF